LAGALLPFWLSRAHRGEGIAMLQTALSWPDAGPPIARAWALNALGRLRWKDSAHWPEITAALEESLAIFRELGDLDGSAQVLDHLQGIATGLGDIEHAMALEEESLRDSRAAGNRGRTAWALQNLASLVFQQGDDERGTALLNESLALFAELESPIGRSGGLEVLAWAVFRRGDSHQAIQLLSENVRLLSEGGETAFLAWALYQLGLALLRDGNLVRAMDVLQESLAVHREVAELEVTTRVLNALGEVALAHGDHAAARVRFRESRALSRELGNKWDAAASLLGEGHVALAEGDVRAASAFYTEALTFFAGLPDWDDRRRRMGVAFCLSSLAGVVGPIAPESAVQLWSSAETLRVIVGRATLHEFDIAYPLPGNRAVEDRVLEACRAALGEQAFQVAWAAGQALTLEQAVAEALDR
jgi:tetratricopeptide (TPR) repeat protein